MQDSAPDMNAPPACVKMHHTWHINFRQAVSVRTFPLPTSIDRGYRQIAVRESLVEAVSPVGRLHHCKHPSRAGNAGQLIGKYGLGL